MLPMDVILDGDGCWPDLATAPEAQLEGVARLKAGMDSGRSSVAVRLKLPDGSIVWAQTSARLFVTAAAAIRARCEQEGETF